jgi:hypothetical protein
MADSIFSTYKKRERINIQTPEKKYTLGRHDFVIGFGYVSQTEDADSLGRNYLIHLEYPRFICRWVFDPNAMTEEQWDAVNYDDIDGTLFAVEQGPYKKPSYRCFNDAILLYDFNFFDEFFQAPTAQHLEKICHLAAKVLLLSHQEEDESDHESEERHDSIQYSLNRSSKASFTAREPQAEYKISSDTQSTSKKPTYEYWRLRRQNLSIEEHERIIQTLVTLSKSAVSPKAQASSVSDLHREVIEAYNQFSPQLIIDAQLSLRRNRKAREELLRALRNRLRSHFMMKEPGVLVDVELWMIPVSFSRLRSGVWTYYPEFDGVEQEIREVFDIPKDRFCLVGRSLWTFERLSDSACIDLYQIYVASLLGGGFDRLIFDDLDDMYRKFQSLNQIDRPAQYLAWLPVLIEHGSLNIEAIPGKTQELFERVIARLEPAMQKTMSIQDLDIGSMFPVWMSIELGCFEWNRRQLGSLLLILGQQFEGHDLNEALCARIAYSPNHSRYEITLLQKDSDESVARIPWLVAPDLVPNREHALSELKRALDEYELEYQEEQNQFH